MNISSRREDGRSGRREGQDFNIGRPCSLFGRRNRRSMERAVEVHSCAFGQAQ